MNAIDRPASKVVAVADLIPTQMTVGLREVSLKRGRWRKNLGSVGREQPLAKRKIIRVILGPQQRHYVIDGHHWARALYDEGVQETPVSIVEDLSAFDSERLWALLDERNWTHPFDADGQRCAFSDVPQSLAGLIDDPFRSLAGELKRRSAYIKSKVPFSEFRWADFLRSKIDRTLVERDFDSAVDIAIRLAGRDECRLLPGWQRQPHRECRPCRDSMALGSGL